MDYVDLMLLHWPCDDLVDSVATYRALEPLVASGKARAIGVSNFNAELLAALAADPRTSVTPAVNQCNHAIGNHNASHSPGSGGDDATVAYCRAHGISYSAFSPLEGLSGGSVLKNAAVIAIGRAHNVSAAQVALRWQVQQGISVVTAASKSAYIAEDLDLWSFSLSAQEMATLSAI